MAVRRIAERYCIEFQQGGERVFRRLPRFATKADATALEVRYAHLTDKTLRAAMRRLG